MPRCSILIVTHNSGAVIEACLASLAAQTETDWEAIAVDNASTDATRERLNRLPRLRRILNASNEGFAAALNQALREAGGDYILTLNPDVVLERSCLERLIAALRCASPDVGMASPKLLRVDRRTIDSTGLVVRRNWRVGDRGAGERDVGQFDDALDILGPCAAAGFYRRAMLDRLLDHGQVFDERFFLLMEDVDLACRARRAGWRGRYVPEAVAYHRGGISRRWSWRAQALAFRNRYYLLAKHHRWGWRDAGWVLAYDVPRAGWLLLSNPHAPRALWDVARNVPRLLRARGARAGRRGA